MTKKGDSIVFILCGTVLSILLFLAIGGGLLFLAGFLFIKLPAEPNVNGFAISLMFIIVLALFLGMFLYQKIVQWAFNKFNLEDKLDPLFKKKYKKTARTDVE
jgi:membrane protein YdbS with pleckstrin-like domain